ncbi:MAG TPA: LLM class F420-dependent oxidoreductase [Acidimicrobiales bacterium]|nr:LLM class F420-dependent oxidoreductase [Acidimicrobiales bacterium]
MLVDAGVGPDLARAGQAAAEAEAAGYDGVWSAETSSDPFLPLLLGAERTKRVQLGTAIAVAFARNPMTLATVANDLQAFSGGRFILGLGSQVRAHVQKRFSMPWSQPAARMRELILAVRAIWRCWQTGEKLDFRGQFYTHTLMTPFFSPGPNPHGVPKVFLAAVGERMAEVAGEVADGLLAHAFTTEAYLRQVTLPAVERGLAASGRRREDFQVCYPGFVVAADSPAERDEAVRGVKAQIAFYGSTPAYRPVLELHGWGGLQDELNALSKAGRWEEMGGLVSDEVLDAFAIVCAPEEVPERLKARFGGLVDRVSFYAPYRSDPGRWRPILEAIKS